MSDLLVDLSAARVISCAASAVPGEPGTPKSERLPKGGHELRVIGGPAIITITGNTPTVLNFCVTEDNPLRFYGGGALVVSAKDAEATDVIVAPLLHVDEHGMPPTQEQISQAMDWLATRGYGQAPQMLHVENIHRLELSGAPVIDLASKYSPAKLAQIRALLALPAGSASQPGQQPAASNDQPASTDLEPELADREPEVEDADFTMQDAIDDDATSG